MLEWLLITMYRTDNIFMVFSMQISTIAILAQVKLVDSYNSPIDVIVFRLYKEGNCGKLLYIS